MIGPLFQDIGRALQEFAMQKGYTVIFDLAKDNAAFQVAIGDEKAHVTRRICHLLQCTPGSNGPEINFYWKFQSEVSRKSAHGWLLISVFCILLFYDNS